MAQRQLCPWNRIDELGELTRLWLIREYLQIRT